MTMDDVTQAVEDSMPQLNLAIKQQDGTTVPVSNVSVDWGASQIVLSADGGGSPPPAAPAAPARPAHPSAPPRR